MTKEQTTIAISARIVAAIGNGNSVQEAFDAVLGEGAYARIAGEVYDELNARQAA